MKSEAIKIVKNRNPPHYEGDFWYNSSTMAKQKKKRNKQYSGADAAVSRPTVTRVSAVERSKFGQWWFENKRIAKPVLIAAGVIIVIVLVIVQIVSLAS